MYSATAKRALPTCLLVRLSDALGSLRNRKHLAAMLSCRCVAKPPPHPPILSEPDLWSIFGQSTIENFLYQMGVAEGEFWTQNKRIGIV